MKNLIPYSAIKENIAGCIDIPAISKLIEIIKSFPGNSPKDNKGGALAICDKNTYSVAARPFGEISLAQTKENIKSVMYQHSYMVFRGRLESTDIRGSILFNNLFVSFYGFYPLFNEALSLIYGIYFTMSGGLLPLTVEIFKAQAEGTARKDYPDNPYILAVLKEFLPWYASERLEEC